MAARSRLTAYRSETFPAMSTRMPCGPSSSSLSNVMTAIQMMGETSTPPTGATARRVGASSGSVGR